MPIWRRPSSPTVSLADRELVMVAAPGQGLLLKKRRLDIDAALIACHGGPGEDGTLQGLLDLIGLRYSGPGQAASALGMDKLAFGAAMAAAGLPTLPRAMVTTGEEPAPSFDGPFIVKPWFGGSSIGIEVAEDWPTVLALKRRSTFLDQGAVVEPFLTASRDLQVAVRTYPKWELSAIEAPARAPDGIYSYDQKYLAWGGRGERRPGVARRARTRSRGGDPSSLGAGHRGGRAQGHRPDRLSGA